ncbi:MAG TPA: isoprenylcysteine carboxylmethyltransferase family protein [Polyangiales bacterium]|nr:isoprenylcysteine carboxylmethyltransferase family protein [Polyangiales bacterium]
MRSLLSIVYGLVAYVIFLGSFLYAIGFVGNFAVPKSIDTGPQGSLAQALIVNLLLLASFAVQHSVMARAGFKRVWTRVVPPAVERSTFVLFASLVLIALYTFWRPITTPIWTYTEPAATLAFHAVFWLGWGVLLISTFLINHFELFGLRQVFASVRGKPAHEAEFRTPGLYRYVRHPIYLGFVLGFWATPTMTAGHLLFAVGTTGYILLGIWFEERDLIARFGNQYRAYREQVGMLFPWRRTAPMTQGRRAPVEQRPSHP